MHPFNLISILTLFLIRIGHNQFASNQDHIITTLHMMNNHYQMRCHFLILFPNYRDIIKFFHYPMTVLIHMSCHSLWTGSFFIGSLTIYITMIRSEIFLIISSLACQSHDFFTFLIINIILSKLEFD